MSDEAPLTCVDCGKGGIIYMVDGDPVCSGCMTKHRPPLTYKGPDRRRRQVPTMFLRRSTDSTKKK